MAKGVATPGLIADLEEFKGLWTRRILEENPVRLVDLENLRTTPEGPLRIRAGVKKPVAIGGSWDASSPLNTGSTSAMITGGTALKSPWPIILRRTAGGVFSEALSQQAFTALFTAASTGERFYFISPGGKFSTIIMNIGRANVNLTLTWKYSSPSGDTVVPGLGEQFTSTGEKVIQFVPPTSPTWGGAHTNGYFGFYIYVEITAVGGGPVIPRICQKRISGDFPSRMDLILAQSDTQVSATSCKLKRFGPTYPNTRWPIVDDNGGSGHQSGYDAPVTFTVHDGILYWTNGLVQRRFQGDPALNAALGFPKPATAGFSAAAAGGVGTGNLTGTYLYAVAYGYGPNGKWGKGTPLVLSGTPPAPNGQRVDIAFPTEVASLNAGIVDVVYVYRSWPLDGASAATYNSQPLYQIAAVARQDTDGAFPLNTGGVNIGYSDNDANFPDPLDQMDKRDRTPPSRIRHITMHKNRLCVANSREHPARVWVGYPGEYEAFDQFSGLGHQDFTSNEGDEVTGIVDYNDQLVVFTNRSMHAIINLSSDDWTPITIHPEIGCIAPASIKVAYGRLFWLAKSGPWMWDGQNDPEYIGWPVRIENMSSFIHGRSRAVTYDYGYELELIPWDRGVYPYTTQWPSTVYGSLFTKYHYSLKTKEWSKTTFANAEKSYMQPICTVDWMHFTDYEGRPAPVYARHRIGDSVTDLRVWLGEAGTTDDGTTMTWAMEVLYGPWKSAMMVPGVWEVVGDGSSTPVTSINNATVIGDKPVIQSAPTPDSSSVLTSYQSGFPTPGTGCAVLSLRATGTSTASDERATYLYGVYLYGRRIARRQPL